MKFDDHFEKKHTTVFGAILGNLSKKADDFVRNQMPSYEETIKENEHLYDHWHKFDPTGKITTPDKWRSL